MFSKPNPAPPAPGPSPTPQPSDQAAAARPPRPAGQKAASLIGHDVTIEGNVTAGGELQIDGTVKGDVRVERVTVGEGGQVDGGIFAEAVEVRGRVSGAITAKQVRLFGACHVDGDITHEQLAMETGAFFQGRSLRLQRAPAQAAVSAPRPPEPAAAPKDAGNGLSAKPGAPPGPRP